MPDGGKKGFTQSLCMPQQRLYAGIKSPRSCVQGIGLNLGGRDLGI